MLGYFAFTPVSYTHLDVYKRQGQKSNLAVPANDRNVSHRILLYVEKYLYIQNRLAVPQRLWFFLCFPRTTDTRIPCADALKQHRMMRILVRGSRRRYDEVLGFYCPAAPMT